MISCSSPFIRCTTAGASRGNFQRDGLNSVTVSVQQIAGLHLHVPDFHRPAEIENMGKSVRNRKISREHLKVNRACFVHVADRAVGHHSETVRRPAEYWRGHRR